MIRSLFHRSRDRALSLSLSPIAREIVKRHLTALTPQKILNLEQMMKALDRDGIPGDVIECGLNQGGSAVLLALLAKPERHFLGFGAESEMESVLGTFRAMGVDVDQRTVALRPLAPKEPPDIEPRRLVALAHINCGWPCARRCLGATAARLGSGGFLVLDDHNQPERYAEIVGNFLADHRDFSLVAAKGHTVLTRNN
jgi:hypothetical protein